MKTLIPSLSIFRPGLLLPGIALLVACVTEARFEEPRDASSAEPGLPTAPLVEMTNSLSQGQAAETSGFLLLDRGKDALAWRLFMARQAKTTLDAQYFLWKDDRAGKVYMQALMAAAERGVRVRVLVDDSMTEADPHYLASFSAHPNVEVRLYKPFGPRHNDYVLRWLDFAADFKLLNRRMHNKLFIADDSVLVVGGRNIGEDYFEYLAPSVFRCRDLLALGPIAAKASTAFDTFWNSDWAVPVEDMVAPVPDASDGEAFLEQLSEFVLDNTNFPPGYRPVAAIDETRVALEQNLVWAHSQLLLDTVPGADGTPAKPWHGADQLGKSLYHVAAGTREEILVESAYLILTEQTHAGLKKLDAKGVEVRALTNSLASNNHISAFDGYRKQRRKQLRLFHELYEYRPDAHSQTALYDSLAPGQAIPQFGLHTKTTVFDRRVVFVGSFNLDPRSQHLNTEIGLLVESEDLGEQVAQSILGDMAPGNAWRLRIGADGETEWTTVVDGRVEVEPQSEPLASTARRLEADLVEPVTPAAEM